MTEQIAPAQEAPAVGNADVTSSQGADGATADVEKTEAGAANEQEADSAKAAEQQAADNDDGDEDQPKKRTGARRTKARLERVLAELAEANRELEAFRKTKTEAKHHIEPPKPEDFRDDAIAYERAMLEYTVRNAASEAARDGVNDILETRQAKERQAAAIEAEAEILEGYAERVADIKANIPDFDDAMKAMAGVNVRNDIAREITMSEKGPLIAYHIAKNPQKLRELNAMTPIEVAREIGRLEGSLRMPASNKQTKAPPPAPKITGGAKPAFDPTKAKSYVDYYAWRFPLSPKA